MLVLLKQSRSNMVHFLLALTTTAFLCSIPTISADCLVDTALNDEFASFIEAESIPLEGSCCQADVCGLACPAEVPSPGVGYGIVVGLTIALSFGVGVWTSLLVNGDAENYFIAGKSLPLWIVTITLSAQAIESGGLLGNVDLSYKYHFWDGVVIPIGIGFSLLLNALFFAAKLNAEPNVLTLPDVYAKKYGKVVEVLVSLICIVSFIMLLAANLSGLGQICGYLWDIPTRAGIWMAAIIVWAYTISGGLFSVAYTDIVQGFVGWSGCVACAYWMILNKEAAPPVSIGFPGYVYPDTFGEGGACDMYEGIACENVPDACCYNVEKYCTDPTDAGSCSLIDNGAYPFGDQPTFNNQMTDAQALTPFPNAFFYSWVTLIVLAFGNLAALDFQVRCMAAVTPRAATLGCIFGGCFTFFVGIPFSYLGGITRVVYGPDSIHAEFDADTCSDILGLPTCGAWVPDEFAFIKLLTNEAPAFLGAWCLVGIVAASMSTADGAILAMGTCWAHNVTRQFDAYYPNLITPENLLRAARISTIPLTLIATLIADQVRNTGYLLIVAFDIVLAAVVAPLFGCYYMGSKPSPRAAFLSVCFGAITRVVMEFTLPKDGYLVLPLDHPEFVDYGSAASSLFPVFFDQPPELLWNSTLEPCDQPQLKDYTGVDSLVAFIVSIITFLLVAGIEDCMGGPLFDFPGLQPYEKVLGGKDEEDGDADEKDPDVSGKTKVSSGDSKVDELSSEVDA